MAGHHLNLLLDFSDVRFLSSYAIVALVHLRTRVDAAGGSLRLCCLEPHLVELLRLAGQDRILAVDGTRQEALDRF